VLKLEGAKQESRSRLWPGQLTVIQPALEAVLPASSAAVRVARSETLLRKKNVAFSVNFSGIS